jgi:hypothetical protein
VYYTIKNVKKYLKSPFFFSFLSGTVLQDFVFFWRPINFTGNLYIAADQKNSYFFACSSAVLNRYFEHENIYGKPAMNPTTPLKKTPRTVRHDYSLHLMNGWHLEIDFYS